MTYLLQTYVCVLTIDIIIAKTTSRFEPNCLEHTIAMAYDDYMCGSRVVWQMCDEVTTNRKPFLPLLGIVAKGVW